MVNKEATICCWCDEPIINNDSFVSEGEIFCIKCTEAIDKFMKKTGRPLIFNVCKEA